MTEIAPPLIDAELAASIVERALEHGGDFAEVFCEQRAAWASPSTSRASSACSAVPSAAPACA